MCLFEGITDYDYASIKKIELLKGGRNKQRPYVASGWLNNETKVVIKALVRSTNSTEDVVHQENYSRELGIGAKNRHPNLLSTMGGCFERRLIIIEYQANRSLKEYFQKHTLTDVERISVAIEVHSCTVFVITLLALLNDVCRRMPQIGARNNNFHSDYKRNDLPFE
ncbi:hypothetical protein PRIPAC_90746 [Pristionchus pacificus]|nr:hypothetical protein PRIPAC_90746 [Pristionchus pacificus]